jgi:hypothetical protein
VGTPPSNFVGPFEVSGHVSPPGEHDQARTCVSARTDDAGQYNLAADLDLLSADRFERDAWTSTPLLRRRGDPLSNRTKFLNGAAVAAVLGSYFIFGSSDRPADVAVTPEPAIGIPQVAFSLLREADAHSPKAMDMTVESRAVPESQMASLEPMGRLDIKPTDRRCQKEKSNSLRRAGMILPAFRQLRLCC